MQPASSFILLLGSLFVIVLDAYAIPLTHGKKGVVTLSLKRTPMRRDLHPHILLQVHKHRSHRRLAHMTGREVSSANGLRDRLAVRSSPHVGYPLSQLGINNDPNVASTKTPEVDSSVLAFVSDDGFNPVDAQAQADDALTLANTPQTANSLGLDDEANDTGYVANIQMGNPPRNFKLLMDSGSADLWVGAEGCQSASGDDCGDHVFLGPESSSSFTDTQNSFNVTYGTGAVAGNIITDDIVVAGLPLSGHTFGVATQETPNFSSSHTPFDGIMGLAQSTLSQQQTLTPVESLAKAGLIKEAITSFKLSRLADEKNDGEVTLGGLDSSKFDPTTLVTIPNVNTHGFWEGAIDAVSVNGTDLGLKGRTAILDTGTTLLIVPQGDAKAIHQAIPGAVDGGNGTFTVPCSTNASLALTFGGQSFSIDPRDITFAPVNPNDLSGDCISGISAGQLGGPNQWLAGDVFLKNAYFSTNVGKNTVQLAMLI